MEIDRLSSTECLHWVVLWACLWWIALTEFINVGSPPWTAAFLGQEALDCVRRETEVSTSNQASEHACISLRSWLWMWCDCLRVPSQLSHSDGLYPRTVLGNKFLSPLNIWSQQQKIKAEIIIIIYSASFSSIMTSVSYVPKMSWHINWCRECGSSTIVYVTFATLNSKILTF